MAAGDYSACAFTTGGELWCWGRNFQGQLGPGIPPGPYSLVPVRVPGGSEFVSVDPGSGYTCALKADGSAWCWGGSGYGGLGAGVDQQRSLVPVQVSGGLRFREIETSRTAGTTCGITLGGAVYCWGANFWGQVGDGTTESRYEPVLILDDAEYVDLDLGELHSCALRADGQGLCWGLGDQGQLGSGSFSSSLTPVPLAGSFRFAEIQAGSYYSAAVTAGGWVYTWGQNWAGQLGDGTFFPQSSP